MNELMDFHFEPSKREATWGSGHTNGQLYVKLSAHNMILPLGIEGDVGSAGLVLGCGRGPVTQYIGRSCDRLQVALLSPSFLCSSQPSTACSPSYFPLLPTFHSPSTLLQEVEYVDYQGDVRVANTTHNQDMLWVARGGGGEFPGIVTKFKAITAPEPPTVHIRR